MAYAMRISDGSSDVFSSVLLETAQGSRHHRVGRRAGSLDGTAWSAAIGSGRELSRLQYPRRVRAASCEAGQMPGPSGTVARSDSKHGPSDSLTLAAEQLSRAVDGNHPLEGLHRCGAAACAPHLMPSP